MAEKDTEVKEPTGDVKEEDTSTGDDSPDLEKVDDESLKDLDEEAQKKIKGFQADYTKKTQALAEERKALKEKAESGEKWDKWFQDNDALVQEFNTWKAKKDKEPEPDDDDDDDDVSVDPKVKKLEKSVAQTQREMNELTKATQVSNKMLVDLMSEVQSKRYKELSFDINPHKVLTYARENSLVDMKRAIDGCYSEEIKEEEFSKRLESEKEKWEEKNKTTVLTDMPLGRQARKVLARKRGSTA